MVWKRWVSLSHRLAWTLVLTVAVLLALYASLGRYAIQFLGDYRETLLQEVTARTGLVLEVETLRGDWSRLAPVLTLEGVALADPADPDSFALRARRAEVRIDVLSSLWQRRLNIGRALVDGLELRMVQGPQGRWGLQGYPPGGAGGGIGVDGLARALAAIDEADFAGAGLHLQFADGEQLQLRGETLSLRHSFGFRRLQGRLAVENGEGSLVLIAEAEGEPGDADFSADLHAALTGLAVEPWAAALAGLPLPPLEGDITNGALWLHWRDGRMASGSAELRVPDLQLAFRDGRLLPRIRALDASFSFVSDGAGWRAWMPEVALQWGEQNLRLTQLQASGDAAGDHATLALAALDLAPLAAALRSSGELPETLDEVLAELAPAGQLGRLRVELPLSRDPGEWRLRAELQGVAIQSWHGAPGAENVHGYIELDAHQGRASLASDQPITLYFPTVYHQPLVFERLRAALAWQVDDHHIRVRSGPIAVEADHGSGVAVLGLDLPRNGTGHAPQMHLSVGLRNSRAEYRGRFIPYFLDPGLLDWLEASIQAGDVPQAGFIYRGALAGDIDEARTIQLLVDVENGALKYQPDWPALTAARGRVQLDDTALDVVVDSARIYDHVAVGATRVTLQDGLLGVEGELLARDDEVLRALRETPVREHLGDALDDWQWRGEARVALALGIPLRGGAPQTISVTADVGPGQLRLPGADLNFDALSGMLHYDLATGLSGENLSARFLGQPLRARLTQKDEVVSLQVSGRADMAALQTWARQPALGLASGQAAVDAELTVGGGATRLRLSSDLVGVELALPAPYHKAAATPLALDALVPLGTRDGVLSARLGDWAALELVMAPDSARGGRLRLLGEGSGFAALESGWFTVTGHIPPLVLDDWQALVTRYREQAGDAPAVDLPPLRLRQLNAMGVQVLDHDLGAVALSGEQQGDNWRLAAICELFEGELRVAADAQQPWQLSLSRLNLPAPASDAETPAAANGPPGAVDRLAELKFGDWPTIDVHIAQWWLGDDMLGSVGFRLLSSEQELVLDQLSGSLRGIAIEPLDGAPAQLRWRRALGADGSAFRGRLAYARLERVLARWGYEPSVESRRGYIDLRAHWQGRPDQISTATLRADIALSADKGRFLSTSETATGALKLVSVFNLANIVRRLQLDFTDVVKSGISFDRATGGFRLANNVLKITEPFVVESPSSAFTGTGTVDLAADRVDMELVVTLPVASNLPWVAALAAGLPVAAGVYVASKLFKDQVDKAASAVYRISGDLSDPKVEFRRVFSAGEGSAAQREKRNDDPG